MSFTPASCGWGILSSHSSEPKYIAQKKEIEKQESQLVHDKDTKLPYTFLNNVIAQSGATSSVYYKSLDTGEVFYNFSGKMPAGGLIRLTLQRRSWMR